MAKKITYAKLIDMAAEYGVQNNPLFVSAADQYVRQKQIIASMQDAIDDAGVTGGMDKDGNPLVHPLVRELPKHTDSANRTLSTMLDIIEKVGRERKPEGTLQALIDE